MIQNARIVYSVSYRIWYRENRRFSFLFSPNLLIVSISASRKEHIVLSSFIGKVNFAYLDFLSS